MTPVVSDFGRVRTNEILGAEVGESHEQIRRYIRRTDLVPDLREDEHEHIINRLSKLGTETQKALH